MGNLFLSHAPRLAHVAQTILEKRSAGVLISLCFACVAAADKGGRKRTRDDVFKAVNKTQFSLPDTEKLRSCARPFSPVKPDHLALLSIFLKELSSRRPIAEQKVK